MSVGVRVDARRFVAYYSTMTNDEINTPHIDPLTIGELITLQEAAEYAGLSKESIHSYVKKGRMKAKKRGWMWFTTRTAVDEYLRSRHLENIPKKHRKSD